MSLPKRFLGAKELYAQSVRQTEKNGPGCYLRICLAVDEGSANCAGKWMMTILYWFRVDGKNMKRLWLTHPQYISEVCSVILRLLA
jgi:hypothetical protein